MSGWRLAFCLDESFCYLAQDFVDELHSSLQYLLQKFIKLSKQLELLPRPLGQGYGYSIQWYTHYYRRKVASVTSSISCPIRLLSGWQECFSQANNRLSQSFSS